MVPRVMEGPFQLVELQLIKDCPLKCDWMKRANCKFCVKSVFNYKLPRLSDAPLFDPVRKEWGFALAI
jgi:hypothetical protein